MAILTPADRVRERIRRWLTVTKLTQRDFSASVKKSQVWLQKVLRSENEVRLADLDVVAQAMRTTAAELVREEDERYQLELTPTEVRVIEQLRRRPELFGAVCTICELPNVVGQIRRDKRAAQS